MAFSTTTEIVVDTIWTTTTVWVASSATPLNNNGFFTGYSQSPSSSAAPTTTSTPTPPPAPTPATSSYVPPTPVPPPAPYDPPPPAAPTTAAAPYVAPPPADATPAASPPTSPSSAPQAQYTGDITYYDVSVGLGSCGWQGSNSQNLVALASDVMQNGPNPNNNPLCGQTISIYYQGNVHQATIYDTCPTCAGGSIDLTEQLFLQVAPDGNGRVSGVSWSINN